MKLPKKISPKRKYGTKFEAWIHLNYGFKYNLAQQLGISKSIISFWCSGRSKPSSKYIMQIWQLSKDEIQPNYWFFEWPSEIKALKESKSSSKGTRRRLIAK